MRAIATCTIARSRRTCARGCRRGAAVLDYGCGDALCADIVAADARTLILCEAAPKVRAALAARFAGNPKIEVRSPEEVAALPAGSLDAVVMHSVAQYLTPRELDALLARFRRLLTDDGVLILGDVLPPEFLPLTDAMALHPVRGGATAFSRAALVRARAHAAVRLSAPAVEARPHPLQRSRHDREARRRRLFGEPQRGKSRPQPGPHDVSRKRRPESQWLIVAQHDLFRKTGSHFSG